MLLGFKFDPEERYPQNQRAVSVWPSLGNAVVDLSMTFSAERELSFREERCRTGGCNQKVLGGTFTASIDARRTVLRGEASGPFGLSGRFELKRMPEGFSHQSVTP